MFAESFLMPTKIEDTFGVPVESIMRCEDFKSNFARKLSNRFTTRTPPVALKKEPILQLHATKPDSMPENVPERIEQYSQLSKNNIMEQIGEAVSRPPDKTLKNEILHTEVFALNMEVETLRWQLAQTEANRQMHIALLKQIVSCLNKVKEHIDQSKEHSAKLDAPSTTMLARSLDFSELPRSRSVAHVNKNIEYSFSTPKKGTTRKVRKAVSNVNSYKECGIWSQSKLSLSPETEHKLKLTEEMTRLIALASTVLSTKLPELAVTCNDSHIDIDPLSNINEAIATEVNKLFSPAVDHKPKAITILQDHAKECDKLPKDIRKAKTKHLNDFLDTSIKLTRMRNEFCDTKGEKIGIFGKESEASIEGLSNLKKIEYCASNFIEDESGFSSMNSFQEIGIPVISIIPPSPCKEMSYMSDSPINLEESEKWKSDTLELEKQSMKVFWV